MNNPNSPVKYIVYAAALITMVSGMFLFTPWYLPPEPAGLFGGIIVETNVTISALLTICSSAPALIGWYRKSYKWTKIGALALFMFYFFAMLIRILVVGSPGDLLWVPHVIISAIMGIIYIYDRRYNHVR